MISDNPSNCQRLQVSGSSVTFALNDWSCGTSFSVVCEFDDLGKKNVTEFMAVIP
jgi:hypothetical protein